MSRNFLGRARTRPPGDMPDVPIGFRGMLEHTSERCTGCGTCAYVCSPGAISIEGLGTTEPTWRYFAGQCTFCGLCVAYCPTGALVSTACPPAVSLDQTEHRFEHRIPTGRCSRCGASFVPVPEATLRAIYGEAVDWAADAQTLCIECRRRAAAERIVYALRMPAGRGE